MEIDYDFNGCLRLTDVVEDFFYSETTGLYIYRHPLIVDERVLKDAIEKNDTNMILSLESDQFIEMLSTVFLFDKHMIHHPEAFGLLDFNGEKIPVITPTGRYGWFNPDKVNLETGLPAEVTFLRDIGDDTFKYWDTHTDIGRDGCLMAVRGYVTSVGKISLDLGFPADAISHRLTVRECCTERPGGALDSETLNDAKELLSNYYRDLENKSIYTKIPQWYKDLLVFIKIKKGILQSAKDVASQVLKDDLYDVMGILWTLALSTGDKKTADEIKKSAQALSNLSTDSLNDDGFINFMKSRKEEMKNAVLENRSIVFVKGHKNPDTDTVISSMAESFRQHLLYGNDSVFVPAVQGNSLPGEIRKLLGDDLAGHIIFSEDDDYITASNTGRPEWIMVDHNIGPEQPDTRAIIDHHYPSDVSLRQQIPRRIIFAGSTTALVSLRFYGMGLEIPGLMAGILLGAALMDTENRFSGKMTPLDEIVMNRLKNNSGINDESAFYQKLMRKLISCYHPDELFIRDYKEDWSFFGFAVAKGILLLDESNLSIIKRLYELALENNKSKNLPLTLVKIVDYAEDAETIRKERVYPVFFNNTSPEFKDAVFKAVVTVIKHESGENVQIKIDNNSIEYWGVGTQLSRKKLAPVLELVVNAFNQYFYSPSTTLFFKRDFLRLDNNVEQISRRYGIPLHHNEDGILVGNPAQLKFLLKESGFLCASPSEYFRAYFDALKVNDERMVSHLTSSSYLETLDAIIENKKIMIEHPEIILEGKEYSYINGNRIQTNILKGEPGLIDPEKIDLKTGLPTEVNDPMQYGTGLWRYWSPDNDCAWVLRSTIFAYDMPALDLKFHFKEVLPRLTIRACTKTVKHPEVNIYEKGNSIIVDVEE